MNSRIQAAAMRDEEIALRSIRYRKEMLRIIKHAGAGHTGGGLSCMDILNVLYSRVLNVTPQTCNSPDRDRYVQSKGHCVEALYVVLADQGFFAPESLNTLCQYKSHFVGHPTRKVPGVEHNTGALGHGLSFCVGLALAARKSDRRFRVFTLMGDGELAEGSVWEAAMSASHHGLDNLIAIVDRNQLQITGRTRDVCSNEPLDAKFSAFGWHVRTVDGHNFHALTQALAVESSPGKPMVVLADTVKGKGVSFMEDQVAWHHRVPSDSEYTAAIQELELAERRLAAGVRA
jgi:transketolase